MKIELDPRAKALMEKKKKNALTIWMEGCGG